MDRELQEYRPAPHRPRSHSGKVYPADPDELSAAIQEYCARTPIDGPSVSGAGNLVGIVSPHIDYARGGDTYARLWQMAAPWLEEVELAVIFGTDLAGGAPR